ncbi:GNAT family N-acetyltransferase [Candidatus Clostridium radicumherbarum]|uniref:GNAT family N-acetyltransferase n=1 Tax=Candidatus Clostridium radicumherbarum TaxID=3381662 RepID=A0ABW8TQR8_9CLOT
MIINNPLPVIETKNLILRKMDYDDIYDIFQMRKDPRMNEFTDTKLDEIPEETRSYIEKMNKGVDENKWVIWAIEHKQSKKVIGSISIWNINLEQKSAELGYGIIPEYQGRGFMKEALLSAADYGFNVMNLETLEAYTEENNIKSIKLLKGCKFEEVDRVDDEGYYNDRIYHMVVYRLTNKRFIVC